jgi:hypothetical protein
MKIRAVSGWAFGLRISACVFFLALAAAAGAQSAAPSPTPGSSAPRQSTQAATHITSDQAKELFALVDQLIQFSSTETALPVKSAVKRQLTTRTAVESYLQKKFNDDEDSKRLQRDEIVLKKFGLLDRDFDLKPFLLALLKEQIEAYYDTKTQTVNMLDWVDAEEQKPVLAHELTHALQDQHSNLEKWDDQTPDDVSTDAAGDNDHLARDEMDTARDAVAEGQATAVMMDYMLKPLGKSIVGNPELMDVIRSQMSGTQDSPVMARAPLLLSESMLFPYREGLSFEQDIWMDLGQEAAFSGALDHPPTSTWEIINPRQYEKKNIPAIPLLPNIHSLVDAQYRPYDIGQIGQLDVSIISQLFGGVSAASELTPAWNGGLYWAGQLRSAKTPAEQASTKSLAFFYLSIWRNEASAAAFERLYARSLVRKYSKVQPAEHPVSASSDGTVEEVYTTDEGPVILTRRGSMVFVSESFPQELARKLATLILDAQGTGDMRMASISGDAKSVVAEPRQVSSAQSGLSSSFVRFFSNCGVMKSAVDAALRTKARFAGE